MPVFWLLLICASTLVLGFMDRGTSTVAADGDSAFVVATHSQRQLIKVVEGPGEKLTTFAVDSGGRVLAGVAADSPMIRVYSPAGEPAGQWKLPIPPEAVNVGPNGDVFVAGQGKLLRLNDEGAITLERVTPNMAQAAESARSIHQRVIDRRTQSITDKVQKDLEKEIKKYKRQLAGVLERITAVDGELFVLDQRDLEKPSSEAAAEIESERARLQKRRAELAKLQARNEFNIVNPPSQRKSSQASPSKNSSAPPQSDPEESVRQLVANQMRIASISASRREVFFACSSSTGFGFDVWRTDYQFNNAQKIGQSLSGCCGQLDVQANDNGIYVAENNKHRVRAYDRDGRQLFEFGSRERDRPESFSGCCNPMNVAFGDDGSVYTAESGIGRIKRFSADGEFVELVGQVELVPGCKKVAISVSPSGDQVYMLDITRGHIIVMTRSSSQSAAVPADETANVAATGPRP